MDRSGFKLIQGGRDENLTKLYRYIYGEITDTRLMGVVGLHLHWQSLENGTEDIHQFYYFDIEELGLDTLTVYCGSSETEVAKRLRQAFGGLGAQMVEVSEKEARYLVNFFIEDTKRKKEPLPPETSDLDYITVPPHGLSEEELLLLRRKCCVDIRSPYGAINYYLMRLFGQDESGAALLRAEGIPASAFDSIAPKDHCTFLMNKSQPFTDGEGVRSFLCQSLVETDRGHLMVFSELCVNDDNKIVFAKKRDAMKLSEQEVSLNLAKPEYLTWFTITCDEEEFRDELEAFALGTTHNCYESGDMYMEYRPDNSHAERPDYFLSDDVQTIFFQTLSSELLISADTLGDIVIAEARLRSKPIWRHLELTGKFHFADSLLFDFAVSGADSFAEFLEMLNIER